MKLTIVLTALILAVMLLGRMGGAAGQDPLLLPALELFTNQDVLRQAPYSSRTTPPSSSTFVPYSETSSIQVTP